MTGSLKFTCLLFALLTAILSGAALGDLPSLGKVDFALEDVNGLTVRSSDYLGAPLFIAFGPAW